MSDDPGAQYDGVGDEHCEPDTAMKDGKLQMELVDLDFVADMSLQLMGGLKGDRQPDDWKKLDPVKYLPKYRGAVLRHLRAAHTPGATDPETGASHWAAVAVNAMICWGLERKVARAGKTEAEKPYAVLMTHAEEFAREQLHLDTASGEGLDALGRALGSERSASSSCGGRPETDVEYRERLQAGKLYCGCDLRNCICYTRA